MVIRATAPTPLALQPAIVRNPLLAPPDTTVMGAIALMMGTETQTADSPMADLHLEARSSCILVVEGAQIIGILHERTVVRLTAQQRALDTLTLREVMVAPVMTLPEADVTDLLGVLNLLQQHRLRHLPLVDDRGQVTGLITQETLQYLLGQTLLPGQVASEAHTLAMNGDASTPIEHSRRELEQQIVKKTVLQGEHLYHQIIQAQTDLILRSLPDTTITFANDALCFALGQSLEEVTELRWNSFVPPADLDELHRKIAALTPANPTFENINRDYRANNQIGWTQWINLGLFGDRGELIEIQSVGRDVTALQQQIQREQALNRVFQAVRNSLDLDTIFATATAETAQLLPGVNCFVVQYLPERSLWRHVAEFRAHPDTPSTLGFEIPDAGNLFAAQLKALQIVRVEDATTLDDALNWAVAQTIPGAWLLIPLVVEGVLWGSFTVTTTQQPFTWSDEQLKVAQPIAAQLEMAIQQANLYQQAQLELEERRRVELALRESEARFQTMADNVPGVIYGYRLRPDGSDQYTYISSGFRDMYGFEPKRALEDTSIVWNLTHPDDVERLQRSVADSYKTLQTWSCQYRVITPAGQVKWLQGISRPTQQPNGDMIWDGLIIDISEQQAALHDRKRAEDALAASERRYRVIVEDHTELILRWAPDRTVLFVNKAYCNFYGVTPEAFIGQDWLTTVTESVRDEVRATVDNLVRSLTPETPTAFSENKVIDAIGQVYHYHFSDLGIFDANGCLIEIQTVGYDITDRKLAEDALAASERRLRTIIEAEPECVKILAADGTVLDMNPAGLAMLEADRPGQVIGQKVISCILPEYRSAFIRLGRRVFQGETGQLEFVMQGLKGTQRWVDSHAVPLRNEHNEIVGALSITRDITDRKRAEIALQDSEMRFRQLAETIQEVFWMTDVEFTQLLYVSPAYELLWGRTCASLYAQPTSFVEAIYPDDRDRALALRQHQQHHGWDQEYRLVQPDGTLRWIWERAFPVVDATGKLQRVVGICQDISDRKTAEIALQRLNDELELRVEQRTAALQASEVRFRGFFDFAPIGIVVADVQTYRFTAVNQAFCQLLGYSETELLSQASCLSVSVADDWAVERPHAEALCRGDVKAYQIEKRYIKKTGEIMVGSLTTTVLRDQAGAITHFIGMVEDITQRKQAEAQLLQTTAQLAASNRELEAFAYSVSHDLRSPLRAIDGFSRALLEDYADQFGEEGRDYFDRIRSNVRRMGLLIDDLLHLSRVSRSEMQYSAVNLSQLVQEQVQELRAAEPEREVTVVVAPGAIVSADVSLMRVVINNLLQNAWKFTSHHPTAQIEFGVMPPAEQPTYYVRDDGAGFDMAYAEMLFGVFQRLHNTHEFPGTGIGLATVQRVIQRHGGRVWADGAVEQGATIYFTLPPTPITITTGSSVQELRT